MSFVRKNIEYENHKLSYLVFGRGEEVILAFHGFGQSAEEFYPYIKPLESKYKVFVFDHFFHGLSNWGSNYEITEFDIKSLFDLVFKTENINKFHILAYSLGGKWAFTIFRVFPNQVQQISLFAPDGVKVSFYYSFSSKNWFGRKLFYFSIQKAQFFYGLLRLALKMGIIKKMLYRFVYFQMNTVEKRNQVYNTWTKYRKLEGLTPYTIRLINQKRININFFLGAYDNVIKPTWFDKCTKKMNHASIKILKKGHRSILTSITSNFE